MSQFFRFPRWPPFFLLGIAQSSQPKSLVFSFSERERDIFARIWCHYQGFPAKIWGNPPQNRHFGRFRPIMCMPINKLNVMIPVLLKTSFKYRFHPPCPLPHPFPHPSCSHPLAPFCNPFPQQFTPLPKVNRQLKIVNYFTCMRHFFCRW